MQHVGIPLAVRVCGCMQTCLISALVLLAQVVANSQPQLVELSQNDFGCHQILLLTELTSKPGLQSTGYVSTFGIDERAPKAEENRPGIEVNFHNMVFQNHTVPTAEDVAYGFAQVVNHVTLQG